MKPSCAYLPLSLILVSLGSTPGPAAAQDPFEIQVYGHETVPAGAWEVETHLSYTAIGTTAYEGSVAPTEHQAHMALEVTRGLTDHWELTAYVLSAHRSGPGLEFAGWRVRSRVR